MKRKFIAGGFAALLILTLQASAEPATQAEPDESPSWNAVVDWIESLLDDAEPPADEIGPHIDGN